MKDLLAKLEEAECGPKLLTLAKVGPFTDRYLWLCRREWMRQRTDEEVAALRARALMGGGK